MKRKSSDKLKSRLFLLLKTNAFFKRSITLSSGKKSNYYIDGRLVTLSAEGAWLSAKIILKLIQRERIGAIGGPTIGADPIIGAVAAVSFLEKKPLSTFIIRSTSKAHGRQQLIEGPKIKRGTSVILVDDVATTGGSIIKSIKILRKRGIKVKKAIVLVDRQEGARELLAKAGCRLISIFTASDFLK